MRISKYSTLGELIGNNLRYLRTHTYKETLSKKLKPVMKPVTQIELAKYLNVTFQQIQKYENNINGIDSIKLFKLSKFFNVPMELFFDRDLIEKNIFAKLLSNDEKQNII